MGTDNVSPKGGIHLTQAPGHRVLVVWSLVRNLGCKREEVHHEGPKSAKGGCMEFDDLSNRVIGCARLKDGIKRFVL
jgi:hypothetical protein